MSVRHLRLPSGPSGTTREALSYYGMAGGSLFITAGALLAVAAHSDALTSRDYLKLALLFSCLTTTAATFRGKADKPSEIFLLCSAFGMGGALAAYAQTYPSSADSPAFFAGWACLIFPFAPYSKYVLMLTVGLLDLAVMLQLMESTEGLGSWFAVICGLWHLGIASAAEAVPKPAARRISVAAQLIAMLSAGGAMMDFVTGGADALFPACLAVAVAAPIMLHARYVRLRANVLASGVLVGCVCLVTGVFRAFPSGAEVSALCVSGVVALAVLTPASSYLLRLHASSEANRKGKTP